jgi:hypothetical protein
MIRVILLVLMLLAPLQDCSGNDTSQVTRKTIVEKLRDREKGLTSVEIHGRTFVVDKAGERVSGVYETEFRYSQTSRGEQELREILIAPDGTRSVSSWVRDDGSKLYTMQCTPKSEHVVENVVIEESPPQSMRSSTTMTPYTNILTPRGKRLADLVSAAKSISVIRDEEGEDLVEAQVEDGGYVFSLLLSASHDYVPREVKFAERDRRVVSTYKNIDGFWFPMSAVSEQISSEGGLLRIAIQIDRVDVNPKKSTKDYGMPKLEVGTVIHNRTKNGSRSIFGVSNQEPKKAGKAVKGLRAKYGSVSDESKEKASMAKLNIASPVDPETSNTAVIGLFLGSVLALVAAGAVWMRR